MSELRDLSGKIVDLAKAKGADAAAASSYRSRQVEVEWRDGRIEKVTEATTRGASLDLYVDGRYSAVSTSDLRDDALVRFIADAIEMTRALEKDPFRSLPDPHLYEGRSTTDLMLRDPGHEKVTADVRRQEAQEIEAMARTVPGASAIVSVSSWVSDSLTSSARVTSNGFQGEMERGSFSKGLSVTCKDGDGRRPEDWVGVGARFRDDLPKNAGIASEASDRALRRLGAHKIGSSKLTLIVEPRAAGRLVRALVSPLSGYAIQQKQSFLDGKLGKRVASSHLTLVDDPLLPKGLGSRPYDGDGFASKRRPIVEAGVLRAFLVDDYYGKKMKVAPTTGGLSNAVFAPGKKGLEALADDAHEAIVVTSFLGGNTNSTTGDYSLGVSGYRVRAGKRAEPITEMNIAGNQRDLWTQLVAVGNDPYAYSSYQTPTLVFERVTFAGA